MMKNDELLERKRHSAKCFENAFNRLLLGDNIDFYAPDTNLSQMFEVLAANLMAEIPARKFHWYDGVVGLNARIRKSCQVEFTGEMWVADTGNGKQWKEEFRARVTDKRATKQGIEILIWIGADRASGELMSAFGIAE